MSFISWTDKYFNFGLNLITRKTFAYIFKKSLKKYFNFLFDLNQKLRKIQLFKKIELFYHLTHAQCKII